MNNILCPTDFSTVSQNALLYAVEFAKKSKATLILFHTEFIPEFFSSGNEKEKINIPTEGIQELKEKLESLIIQLKLHSPEVQYHYVLEEGLVAENIAMYANKHNVDLIIMGTHGCSGMEAIFTGSNSVRVMEKSNCPVLIIPEQFNYTEPNKFVYAADLLDNETEIVGKILPIVKLFEAELELVHIKGDDDLELVSSEAAIGQIIRSNTSTNIRYKILQGDDSIAEIEDYAKSTADILILAQRKKSFIEKLFSRNRAEQIAYHAQIPLLIMHKS